MASTYSDSGLSGLLELASTKSQVGVTSLHPRVLARLPEWCKVDDAVEGEDRVKQRRELYLPRLNWKRVPGWQKRYDDYLLRAEFPDLTRRTRDGVLGLLLARPIGETLPGAAEWIKADATGRGVPLRWHAREVVERLIAPSRVGVLVDVAESGEGRPWQSIYSAANITNWTERRRVDGRYEIFRVVLRECALEPDSKDEYGFAQVDVVRYRELALLDGAPPRTRGGSLARLDPALTRPGEKEPRNVYLAHRIWEQDAEGEWAPRRRPGVTDDQGWIVAVRRDRVIDQLTFRFGNPSSLRAVPETPLLLGIANLNYGIYRNIADLENFCHWSGRPQLYWWGYKPPVTERARSTQGGVTPADVEVGVGVWLSEDTSCQAGYAQIEGGVEALERRITSKKDLAVELGARLVEVRPVQRTATEADIRDEGEKSQVAKLADVASQLVTETTALQVWWDAPGDVPYEEVLKNVKVKVQPARGPGLSAAEARAWAEVNLVNKDALADRELFDLFNREGVYGDGMTYDDHKRLVSAAEMRDSALPPDTNAPSEDL